MALLGRHVAIGNRTISISDFQPAIPGHDGQILSYNSRAQSASHLEWIDQYPPYGVLGAALLSDGMGGGVWGHDPYSVILQEITAYADSTTNVPYGDPADVVIKPYENGIDLELAFDFVIPFGPQGDQGIQGPYSTLDAGTASSVPYFDAPYVVNEGTPYDAVFSFGIPQGVPGDSAYDVWNKSPYGPGTQAEYFEFLKGEQGHEGHDSYVSIAGTYSTPYGTAANVVDLTASDPYSLELEFYIPYGGQGAKGDTGNTGDVGLNAHELWMAVQPFEQCFSSPYDPTMSLEEQRDKLDPNITGCSLQDFYNDININIDPYDIVSGDQPNAIILGTDGKLLVEGGDFAKLDEPNVFTEPNNFQEKLSVGPDETFFVEVRSTPINNPFALDTDRIKDFTLTPGFITVDASWGYESFSYDSIAMYDKDVDGVQGKELANVDYVDDAVSAVSGSIDFDPYATVVYSDSEDARVLSEANLYTDQAIDAIPDINFDPYATTDYVDQGDKDTLDAAKQHSDNNDQVTLDAANKHSDDNDVITLDKANDYTDTEVNKRVAKAGDTMTGKLQVPNLEIDYGTDVPSNRNTFKIMGNISDGAGGTVYGMMLKDYRRKTPTNSADYIDYSGAVAGDNSIMNRGYADGRYANKKNTEDSLNDLNNKIDELAGVVDRGNWEYVGLQASPGPGEFSYQMLTSWADARDFKISKVDQNGTSYDFHSVQANSLVRIQTLDANLHAIGAAYYEVTTFNNSNAQYFSFNANYINHSGYGKADPGDIQHVTLVPSGSIDDSDYAKVDRDNEFLKTQYFTAPSGAAVHVKKTDGSTAVRIWPSGTISQDANLDNTSGNHFITRKNMEDFTGDFAKKTETNKFTAGQQIDIASGDALEIFKGGVSGVKLWANGSIEQQSDLGNDSNRYLITRKNANDAYGRLGAANTWTNKQTINRSGDELIVGQKSGAVTIKMWADGSIAQIADHPNTADNNFVTRKNLTEAIAAIPSAATPRFHTSASPNSMSCISSLSSNTHSQRYFMPMASTGANTWNQYTNNTGALAFFITDTWFGKALSGGGTIVVKSGSTYIGTYVVTKHDNNRTSNGKSYQQVFCIATAQPPTSSWSAGTVYTMYFSGTHWA